MDEFKGKSGSAGAGGPHASSFSLTALNYTLSLPRYFKRAILMLLDFSLLSLALWCSFSLRLAEFYVPETMELWALLISAPLIGVLSFHYNGLYKLITRFAGSQGAIKVCVSMAMAVLIWCLVIYMSTFTRASVPRSVIAMYGVSATLFVWSARNFLAFLLVKFVPYLASRQAPSAVPVIIYGVGDVGRQLAGELRYSSSYRLVSFVDKNPSLWRQMLDGVRVNNPASIEELVKRQSVREIFLADEDMTRRQKRELVNALAPYHVTLKNLSPLHDIASGKVTISDLKQVGLEDLLGRPPVPPRDELLSRNITGKSVMITGAGGSIGSELARQVAGLQPRRLILLEHSELALYNIDHEIKALQKDHQARGLVEGGATAFEVVSLLGSVLDNAMMFAAMRTHEVETVYHAAAYKHVPIVEDNPVAGLRNNLLGTMSAADAAREAGVGLFVLISTDKAVRPTNVMGASKRLAELYLQALANELTTAEGRGGAEGGDGAKGGDGKDSTIFTMVRFGNVLGASGSVVKLFREQISQGGPVTVTDPEIIRYFMMIPEAAQLVIQAGALAGGGEVYVLDMGRPVKILDLARSMINLSGLEVADETNPDGDIAIEFVGLRDGEKLFEELLIAENSSKTEHPQIIRNYESHLPLEELRCEIDKMKAALAKQNLGDVQRLLLALVEGYVPHNNLCGSSDEATHDRPVADGAEARDLAKDAGKIQRVPDQMTAADEPDGARPPGAEMAMKASDSFTKL